MKEQKIADGIVYIGVNDRTIDLFESQYVVPNGVSYNSYCILDEKIAIMDTVDYRMSGEWLMNLDAVLQGKVPDYLIISHLEPDHAGTDCRICCPVSAGYISRQCKNICDVAELF